MWIAASAKGDRVGGEVMVTAMEDEKGVYAHRQCFAEEAYENGKRKTGTFADMGNYRSYAFLNAW